MQVKTIRKVRLQGKYEPRVKQRGGYRAVPCLSLSGVWLEQAGFKAGDQVEITIENEKLIIKNTGAHGDQNN